MGWMKYTITAADMARASEPDMVGRGFAVQNLAIIFRLGRNLGLNHPGAIMADGHNGGQALVNNPINIGQMIDVPDPAGVAASNQSNPTPIPEYSMVPPVVLAGMPDPNPLPWEKSPPAPPAPPEPPANPSVPDTTVRHAVDGVVIGSGDSVTISTTGTSVDPAATLSSDAGKSLSNGGQDQQLSSTVAKPNWLPLLVGIVAVVAIAKM